MPTYTYHCSTCGNRFERVLPMSAFDAPIDCDCGTRARKILTPAAVVGDYAGYTCPVSGKLIEGRKAHEENLKRTGCRILEPGEREAAARARVAEDKKLDAIVDREVEQFFESAPASKLENLTNEVLSGALPVVTKL